MISLSYFYYFEIGLHFSVFIGKLNYFFCCIYASAWKVAVFFLRWYVQYPAVVGRFSFWWDKASDAKIGKDVHTHTVWVDRSLDEARWYGRPPSPFSTLLLQRLQLQRHILQKRIQHKNRDENAVFSQQKTEVVMSDCNKHVCIFPRFPH